MVSQLTELFDAAKGFGIFEFYLPFLLAFVLFYALLSKAGIWKDKKGNKFNIIISLILSFFIIGYTPVGVSLSTLFSSIFGGTLIVVVTLLAALIILFMIIPLFGVPLDKRPKKVVAAIVVIAVILAVGIFIASGGTMVFPGLSTGFSIPGLSLPSGGLPEIGISATDIAIIVLFILTAAVILWLFREGKDLGESSR